MEENPQKEIEKNLDKKNRGKFIPREFEKNPRRISRRKTARRKILKKESKEWNREETSKTRNPRRTI